MNAKAEQVPGMRRYFIAQDVEHDGYRVIGQPLTKGFESIAEAREVLAWYKSAPETRDTYITEVTTFR